MRTTAHHKVVDITFPTDPKVTFTGTYDAPRSGGRVHKASDLMGKKHMNVFAAVAGTLCIVTGVDEPTPSYGFMIRLCGDDGRRYTFVHLNNDTPGTDDGHGGPEFAYAPGVRKGVRVTRGQWIGMFGDSGNAEGTQPHLHFEIEDPEITDPYGTHLLDPYYSLKAAKDEGDLPRVPAAVTYETVERVGGADRIATAVAVSRSAFTSATGAVVVAVDSVPDAMAAGPLAGRFAGPVLTTASGALDPRVADELKRLGATRVTIVGGPEAVSPDVEAQLASAGVTSVDRIAGADRWATAALVAEQVWAGTTPSQRRAVVALGIHADPARAWPDALGAGWLGAMTKAPVLLVLKEAVPVATRDALTGVREVVLIGGTAAVSDAVGRALADSATTFRRLAGPDRYGTSAALASHGISNGASAARIWATTGRDFGDALVTAVAAAARRDVLVLIDGLEQRADGAMGRWLWARSTTITSTRVVGGATAMTEAARTRLARRVT